MTMPPEQVNERISRILREAGWLVDESSTITFREAQPADVILVDGKPRMIVAITWPECEVETRNLGEILATHTLATGEAEGFLTLAEVLELAGWIPPIYERLVCPYGHRWVALEPSHYCPVCGNSTFAPEAP